LDEATGTLERFGFFQDYNSEVYFGTLDVTGRLTTWGLVHSVLVGADYYDATYDELDLDLGGTRFARPIPINIFDPVYGTVPEAFLREPPTNFFKQDDSWWGVYVQDQIQLGDKWHALLGFRYDDAEAVRICCPPIGEPVDPTTTIKAQEFSPRFGLLYHSLPWLALYGSYAEGFGGVNEGVTADGSPPGSELSQQYEVGVKAEGIDGRLTGSLAFFDLTRENIATPVPGMLNIVEVAGEVRNRGIELDVSGALTDYWRLIASYSYIDSEITKDRDAEGGTGNQGNRFLNAPRHAGSLWTQYEFTQLGWPDLTAGIGAFFVGQREGDNENSFQLPGYGRADAAFGYSWRIGPSKVTAQFNVENLLDKEYFLTSLSRLNIQPGAPRTFLGSIRVEF